MPTIGISYILYEKREYRLRAQIEEYNRQEHEKRQGTEVASIKRVDPARENDVQTSGPLTIKCPGCRDDQIRVQGSDVSSDGQYLDYLGC